MNEWIFLMCVKNRKLFNLQEAGQYAICDTLSVDSMM